MDFKALRVYKEGTKTIATIVKVKALDNAIIAIDGDVSDRRTKIVRLEKVDYAMIPSVYRPDIDLNDDKISFMIESNVGIAIDFQSYLVKDTNKIAMNLLPLIKLDDLYNEENFFMGEESVDVVRYLNEHGLLYLLKDYSFIDCKNVTDMNVDYFFVNDFVPTDGIVNGAFGSKLIVQNCVRWEGKIFQADSVIIEENGKEFAEDKVSMEYLDEIIKKVEENKVVKILDPQVERVNVILDRINNVFTDKRVFNDSDIITLEKVMGNYMKE